MVPSCILKLLQSSHLYLPSVYTLSSAVLLMVTLYCLKTFLALETYTLRKKVFLRGFLNGLIESLRYDFSSHHTIIALLSLVNIFFQESI